MNKSEIIIELERMALHHMTEAQKFQKAVYMIADEAYPVEDGKKGAAKFEVVQRELPGYSTKWEPLEKFRYFEDRNMKVWNKTEISEFLTEAEGSRAANKIMSEFRAYAMKAVKANKLARLSYNNSKLYIFFTTRQEWIDKSGASGNKYLLLTEHCPKDELLGNLSEEQKSPKNIVWAGIQD